MFILVYMQSITYTLIVALYGMRQGIQQEGLDGIDR